MFGKKPASIEDMALSLAKQFGLDLQEVTETFSGKESNLRSFFNQASEAKHDRTKYAVETAILGAVAVAIWPVAIGAAYTGYKAYEGHKALNWVGNQVQAEIEKSHALPASAPPAPTAT